MIAFLRQRKGAIECDFARTPINMSIIIIDNDIFYLHDGVTLVHQSVADNRSYAFAKIEKVERKRQGMV